MMLNATDELTLDIVESGCVTWDDLVRSVRNFKYGRGADRSDFEGVWYRRKGTCSTKHGFLKEIANRNGFNNVELMVGIYLMTAENTPSVATILNTHELQGIPEAHCYLKVDGSYLDATSNSSDYNKIAADLLEEKSVDKSFLVSEKIDYHKEYLMHWLQNEEVPLSLDELWGIREDCIAALSE
ncbi:MAG: hypothetical protein Crog4KO_30290 [Crocinitomicaceae bacterium]